MPVGQLLRHNELEYLYGEIQEVQLFEVMLHARHGLTQAEQLLVPL